MYRWIALLLLVVCLVQVYGDRKCTSRGGKCQRDSIWCAGGYQSGLCYGASNRRCCLPRSTTGDRKCTSRGGKCQRDSIWCAGGYQSGLCSGASNRRCCLPRSSGSVDYRGYRVSDSRVRAKLQQIASLFGRRLYLFSGNRNGGGRSHHDVGRAADFWIEGGLTGSTMFDRIRRSGILSRDYQVIWHGTRTCTGGQHLHIGRYGDNRRTCWVHEGTRSNNRCVYHCM